jgi:hypothetical protein
MGRPRRPHVRRISAPAHRINFLPALFATEIHAYLDDVLSKKGVPVGTFANLAKRKGTNVTVISTNLRDRTSTPSKSGDFVIPALIDSAGLPYLLRKWGAGGSPVIVDGGVGDNLPATRLDLQHSEDIPVCISFSPCVNQDANPESFKKFTIALLDAAIDVSASQSAALVPKTFFIDTNLDTFDFKKAIASISDGEYSRIYSAAIIWFNQLYDDVHTLAEQKAVAYSVMNLHPWQSESSVAQAVMAGVWSAVTGQFAHQLLRFHQMELRATLNCLQTVPRPDILTFTVEFEAGAEALYCYWIGVSDGVAGQLSKAPTWSIKDADTGAFVPHVRVPATAPGPDDKYARYEVIFFTPALVEGKRYILVQIEEGKNLLKDLVSLHKDELGVYSTRVLEKVGEVRLIVDIPDQIKNYSVKIKPDLIYDKLSEFYPAEVAKRTDISKAIGYESHMLLAQGSIGLFALDITIGS